MSGLVSTGSAVSTSSTTGEVSTSSTTGAAPLSEPVEMSGTTASFDEDRAPWLVVIDPQAIFASPGSEWGSPYFAEAFTRIERLAEAAGDRVLVTRWLPTADRATSWGEYFEAWPFADKPADDALFELVPGALRLSPHPTLDLPTFGKWGAELEAIIGRGTPVVLVGVSTDCCVLSTALAGADAGARITIATDACAGSSTENHDAAVHVMGLYSPQLTLASTEECLALLRG